MREGEGEESGEGVVCFVERLASVWVTGCSPEDRPVGDWPVSQPSSGGQANDGGVGFEVWWAVACLAVGLAWEH